MKRINSAQRKSLADFGTTVAAAWFSAGIIAPLFTKPKSYIDVLLFLAIGAIMTIITLRWALLFLEGVKS